MGFIHLHLRPVLYTIDYISFTSAMNVHGAPRSDTLSLYPYTDHLLVIRYQMNSISVYLDQKLSRLIITF